MYIVKQSGKIKRVDAVSLDVNPQLALHIVSLGKVLVKVLEVAVNTVVRLI